MGGVDGFFNLDVPEVVAAGILHSRTSKSTVDDMALQRVDAVAAKVDVGPGIVDRSGHVGTMTTKLDDAVAVEAQHAAFAFDQHLAHRQAAVLGLVVGQAIAVEQARHTILHVEDDEAGVFSRDHRVELAQGAKHPFDFAEQEAECIDQVDRGFVHQKARHLLEVGLPVEVGTRALTVAGSQPEGGLIDFTQQSRSQQPLQFAMPRLEPEILVDRDPDTGLVCDAHGLVSLGQRSAKRLLADHVDAACRGLCDGCQVRFRRRDDVEQLRSGPVQHRPEVAEGGRYPVLGCDAFGCRQGAIADADERDLGDSHPGTILEAAEVAGPGGGDTDRGHGAAGFRRRWVERSSGPRAPDARCRPCHRGRRSRTV